MKRFPLLFLLALTACPRTIFAQTPRPDPFALHLQAAQNAACAGLPLNAAREYRAALRLHPDDASACEALAGQLEKAGRPSEAITAYRETIRLRPDNAPAHNALALLLEDRGETAAALAQYRQALALDPGNALLHFNLAAALEAAGQPASARAEYQQALRLQPDFPEARAALRETPNQDRPLAPSTGKAGEEPLPATPIKPRSSPPSPPSGSASAERRGEEKNRRSLLTSSPSRFGRGDEPKRAGWVPTPPPSTVVGAGGLAAGLRLERAGRTGEAIAAFRAVLARDPANAAAHLHLGIALYADGQAQAARREWQRVLTLSPTDQSTQARRLLAKYP